MTMRTPRYEDYVTYDGTPEPEEVDDLRDPMSGRLNSEIAAQRRAAYFASPDFDRAAFDLKVRAMWEMG
jgi:hypothetical protein